MKFKLTPMFTKADIDKATAEFMDRVVKVTKNELTQVGLEFVRDAREKQPDDAYGEDAAGLVMAAKLAGGSLNLSGAGGFNDQTGNLRSSIGFIITYDGEIVHEDFELSTRGSDKTEGIKEGKELAKSLVQGQGWGIITVAGMEYASWVEAKGYDVITGSTLQAEQKLKKAMDNVMRAFK